jgi:hypothetical protein
VSGSLAPFLIFKAVLVAGALGWAIRERRALRRPDDNPQLTQRLLHVFSAGNPARSGLPEPAAELVADPETPRRAA